MKPLNILITSATVYLNGGREYIVRDLALGLEQKGHRVAVIGDGAVFKAPTLSDAGVTIYQDCKDVPFSPDVVHGQGAQLLFLSVLTQFPDAAGIHHFDAAMPLNAAIRHPRIYRYTGITETMRLRVVTEGGIPEAKTDVVPNAVDRDRFVRPGPPPRRLSKALFFNGYHQPGGAAVEAVRAATERAGIELDFLGRYFGDRVDHPEAMLPDYDLVFACGRSALEALSCGCALITLSITGVGEMVRRENFNRIRAGNFTAPMNTTPPSADATYEEISRFDLSDCAFVSDRVRSECDVSELVDQVERLYGDVLAEHRVAACDIDGGRLALYDFMRRLAPVSAAVDYVEATEHGSSSRSGTVSKQAVLKTLGSQLSDLGRSSRN